MSRWPKLWRLDSSLIRSSFESLLFCLTSCVVCQHVQIFCYHFRSLVPCPQIIRTSRSSPIDQFLEPMNRHTYKITHPPTHSSQPAVHQSILFWIFFHLSNCFHNITCLIASSTRTTTSCCPLTCAHRQQRRKDAKGFPEHGNSAPKVRIFFAYLAHPGGAEVRPPPK